MSKQIEDANLYITQASNQIDRIAKNLPNLQTYVTDLKIKQGKTQSASNNLVNRIEKLKKQIEIARDLANSIKIGVQFHPNTTLELQPPQNLVQLASDFKSSIYFKTNKSNGFLIYLGNENRNDERKQNKQDYMALEIENGYPKISIDLGDGPHKIISKKNVANGKWHQAIIERTGNNLKLTIREELEDGKEVEEIEDLLIENDKIFDFNRENSKLFIGGYPPDFDMQEDIKYSSFEGDIEDLRIGDERVGLWNFIDGQNNKDGAQERDQLITVELQPTGYRFSGNGYVKLNAKPYSFKQRSNIQFKFKASQESLDGLMFYAGQNEHFISVELKNGGIFFQYKLGQHLVSIRSEEQFNDEKWHRVEVERNGRAGILKIDGKTVRQEESPIGTEENLRISDTMYFGGHPTRLEHPEITMKNFDGCIDEVFISGTPINLSRNLKAYGVRAGCSTKFSSIVSFLPNQSAYLRHNINVSHQLRINFKFKTKQNNGIIFIVTDHNKQDTSNLALENGILVYRSNNHEVDSRDYNLPLNDGDWHYVIAMRDENRLSLSVDNMPDIVTEFANPQFVENTDIYFAGISKDGPLSTHGPYFVGCISDVYINGPIVNLAESIERKHVVLDSCAREIIGNRMMSFVYIANVFKLAKIMKKNNNKIPIHKFEI